MDMTESDFFESDESLSSYCSQLEDLRKGEKSKKKNAEIQRIEKLALKRNREIAVPYIQSIKEDQDQLISLLKKGYKTKVEKIKNRYRALLQDEKDKQALAEAKQVRKSELTDAKNRFLSTLTAAKEVKNQAYIDFVQKNRLIRNGRPSYIENHLIALKEFSGNFRLSRFFLDKALYLTIILFLICCVIIAPLSGNGNLLTLPNILAILEQSSVRMFYALGVAGLILLGGTDLSVGRMVALGAVTTGILLHPGMNIVSVFGMGPWDFSFMPMFFRVLTALSLSILLCVLFSAFSGLFTAKLKVHPFISTLSTQMIVYGLLFYGTHGTPVGSIERGIKDFIGGRWILGSLNGELITFPKLILPALIAILAAWFIWNKTVFGKNMYAVGGNADAAVVSGINVFRVTMGVFVMAGIFYGCGSFLEIFKANANAGTGQGYELDAIAACVVGGISLNGGIGKISGAVIGVLSFTSLTYCLTFLGVDTNLQFVFKGLVILAAVGLDSVKNIREN